MYTSNLTDIPKLAEEKDLLGIEEYKNGLIDFIDNAQTPLTIALQGEWGSGKTSLLNSIKYDLCVNKSNFYGVWINTWEYGLMMDESTTLTNIITGIIAEVINVISAENFSDTDKLKKKAFSFLSKVSTAAVKTTANMATGGAVGDSLDNIFGSSRERATVRELRNELQKVILDFLDKHPEQKGFLFFIDDLDRINPAIAVQILELLKNIFDLEKCIFVLAIDYEVVVKGLEPKFGKKTMENEREFRSFFEKIIQLPFSMPVSNYDVKDFLIENLVKLNYFDKEINEEQKDFIQEISLLTVGRNPRSIKRLMNSISLVKCISKNKITDDDSEYDVEISPYINYFLFSLQISYPMIYKVLCEFPEFSEWNDEMIMTYRLSEVSEEYKKIKDSGNELFDETWEKILFLLCQKDFYLKNRVHGISRLFNSIRSFLESHNQNIEQTIRAGLEISSVTAIDDVVNQIPKSSLKTLKFKEFPEIYHTIKQTDGKFELTTKTIWNTFDFSSYRKEWKNKSPIILFIYINKTGEKVNSCLQLGALKNGKERQAFATSLENYGFKVNDRMKRVEAVCSNLLSNNVKLKVPNDPNEIVRVVEELVNFYIEPIQNLEKALLDFYK